MKLARLVACLPFLAAAWLFPGSAAAERAVKTCNTSTLDHDTKLMTGVYSHPSGACYFTASLPPNLSSTGPTGSAGQSLREAYLASDSTVRTALIYGSAAPQILEILTGPLSSNRFTDVEGEAFAKLLAENSDKVAECTEAALTGGTFKMDDSSELRLSCNLADDKTVYELHASFSEISVDLRFPLV